MQHTISLIVSLSDSLSHSNDYPLFFSAYNIIKYETTPQALVVVGILTPLLLEEGVALEAAAALAQEEEVLLPPPDASSTSGTWTLK